MSPSIERYIEIMNRPAVDELAGLSDPLVFTKAQEA